MKIDPKKMAGMMKQMGISSEEIKADKVIIEGEKRIIINNPSVQKIKMQGQESFQISGEVEEQAFSEEDIARVAEKTGKTEEEAKNALEETEGDLAEAILKLS